MDIDTAFVYFWWWRIIVLAFLLLLPLFELYIRSIRYEMRKLDNKNVPIEKERELLTSFAVSMLHESPKTLSDHLLLIFTLLSGIAWLISFWFIFIRLLISAGLFF